VEDVVSGTGIMVRISGPEDELELVALCVIFEKGTLRGRLTICQHISDGDTSWIVHSGITIASYKSRRA
jgi:hypothetical protein